MGAHSQFKVLSWTLEEKLFRQDLDAGYRRDFRRVVWRAGFQPSNERLRKRASFFKEFSAGVRGFTGGLCKNHRFRWESKIDAASRELTSQSVVIPVRIISKK